jgi:hypothetical protein
MMWRSSHAGLLHIFTAAQISTSIRVAECVELRGNPKDAYDRLVAGRFDHAPVVDNRHVVGWAPTARLATVERVRDALRPLAECSIVSEDASIADVLQLVARSGLVFTVNERGLEGSVTPSDFERHAARSHFYLLVAGIEMPLAQIVTERVDPDVILDRLEPESRERWEFDLVTNGETNPAEYLYLRDLAELFEGLPEATPEGGWTPDLAATLTEVCHFRPSVMHANRSLMKGRDAAQLASLARRAEQLTARLDEIAVRPRESV